MLTKEGFEVLFDTYIDDVSRFLSTYALNEPQLQDWVQEVFIKLWEKRQMIDFEHPAFKSYLLKTARHHALKQLKKEKKYEPWLEANLKKITPAQLPDVFTENTSDIEEVYSYALAKISKRARKAYLLSRNDGLTYPEIAAVMSISTKTVESHISKALSILQKELKNYSQSNF